MTGNVPIEDLGQLIAADVSRDGTISGMDVSLLAQYNADLILELLQKHKKDGVPKAERDKARVNASNSKSKTDWDEFKAL